MASISAKVPGDLERNTPRAEAGNRTVTSRLHVGSTCGAEKFDQAFNDGSPRRAGAPVVGSEGECRSQTTGRLVLPFYPSIATLSIFPFCNRGSLWAWRLALGKSELIAPIPYFHSQTYRHSFGVHVAAATIKASHHDVRIKKSRGVANEWSWAFCRTVHERGCREHLHDVTASESTC